MSYEEVVYRAVPFHAPEGSEIIGIAVKGYFNNLQQDSIQPILDQYNLKSEDIDDNGWYPLQTLYDVDKEIYKQPGGNLNLVAVGKAIASNVLDSSITDLEEFLNVHLNRTATTAIRNVPEGFGYIVEKIGHQHYRITSNVPTSNDTVYGYLWEVCRLLKKPTEEFVLTPISGYPGNQEAAVLEVKWGRNI